MIEKPYKAYDKEGNELFLYCCCVMSPVENIKKARIISKNYYKKINVGNSGEFLPTPLSPNGELPITHYVCFDECYNDFIEAMVEQMKSEKDSCTTNKLYTLEDDPEEIKSYFSITATDGEQEFLDFVGLKKVII